MKKFFVTAIIFGLGFLVGFATALARIDEENERRNPTYPTGQLEEIVEQNI